MIKFYKTLENRMTELPEYSEGCWVSAVCPTPDEIRYLIEQLGVDAQYISAALDEEESSRIESEDGQTLVIIDVPYMEEEQEGKDRCLYHHFHRYYPDTGELHHRIGPGNPGDR